jgi:sugar lactone lactonase YvrE
VSGRRISRTVLVAVVVAVAALASATVANADVCVSSLLTNQVLRYDDATGSPLGVCATGGGLTAPRGVTFGPDGNVYVSNTGGNSVLRYDGQTGAFIDTFVAPGSGGLFEPQGLAFGPDGDLFVVRGFASVLRYDGETGSSIGVFASPVFGGAFDLVFGPDGDLYVTSFSFVHRFDGETGAALGLFATAPGGLTGLAFGPDANLYVGASFGGLFDTFVRFDGTTGANLGKFGGVSGPLGITAGPDGLLYVASRDADSVVRVDGPTGTVVDTFVAPGSGGLDLPFDIAFAPADVAPPELAVIVSPNKLRPPRHQYVTVHATVTATDDSGVAPTVKLVSVTSNEPDNGPDDGSTVNDIVTTADPYTVKVRAERSGSGSGRIYTLTYRATDGSGKTTTRSATVTVPLGS